MKNSDIILIDCSFISEGWTPSCSLVIYTIRLVQGFLKYGHSQVHVLVWREWEYLFNEFIIQQENKIVLDRSDLTTSWRPYYRLTGFLPGKLKKEISRRNISVVLNPFHYGTLFFYPSKIRQYGIVHDFFIYDDVKDKRGKISYYIWYNYQKLLLRKFTDLVSISKNTQREFLQRAKIYTEIVYNSIDVDIKMVEQPVEKILGKKYILDINRFPRAKNTETLIRAFDKLKNSIPHDLYLKGDHSCEDNRRKLENLVVELGLEDRVIFDMDYRTEGEMRYLYSHADLFVSPSLKEGFGFTPIEAAILKMPVLVSDIEVFKEISCGKIPTFDPSSPEDLAQHIMAILNNPPSEQEREELAEFFLHRYSLENQIGRLEEIMES
jgi:glycosyltransferase involved in cell wall biosynthesis